jgi:hypothetical protein
MARKIVWEVYIAMNSRALGATKLFAPRQLGRAQLRTS